MTDRKQVMLSLTSAVVSRLPILPYKREDLDANMDYVAAWADAYERRMRVEDKATTLEERDRLSYALDQADKHARAVAGGEQELRWCGCLSCVARNHPTGCKCEHCGVAKWCREMVAAERGTVKP